MSDNNFLKNSGVGNSISKVDQELEKPGKTLKHRAVEDYYAQSIDNSHNNEIFLRKDNEPNSLSSYWNRIMIENDVPTSVDEQRDYFLFDMDNVELDEFYRNRLPIDKDYVERNLNIDWGNKTENPQKFKEKLLERIYAHCLTKAFLKKDVIYGGDNEEISLDGCTKTHPYDLYKRQVQQILSISDDRLPEKKFNIGLSVQWGHENTSDESIKNRLSYIINGIVDYNSMTEIVYTPLDKDKKMPVYIPLAIVGGDIKNMTYFIDKVMKEEYSEITKSSIMYNALIQMKTQIDLFYEIASKQRNNYSTIPAHLSEHDKIAFVDMGDRLQKIIETYKTINGILDQVIEANGPSIQNVKPDSIHKKIMNACEEIAKENSIV